MIDEKDIAKTLRRPGAGPAFLAAAGVLVALLVLGALSATLSALASAVWIKPESGIFLQIWGGQVLGAVAGPLPIAIGVFLCFWQIAPIAANLRLAHVVTRSVLAALVGALILFVVSAAYVLVVWLLFVSTLFPVARAVPTPIGQVFFQSLATVVTDLPVVVLGGVLLWGWLQRHPPKHPVGGTLDEV